MSLFSYFWDSEVHLNNLAFVIEVVGCAIEIIIATIAVVTLPKAWAKERKERIKKLAESFAIVAAIVFLVALVSNRRTSSLQEKHFSAQIQGVQTVATNALLKAAEANQNKQKFARLDVDWCMAKNGSLTNSYLVVTNLSSEPLLRGWYKVTAIFYVVNCPVDPTNNTESWCRTVDCGMWANKYVRSYGSMAVIANGAEKTSDQHGKLGTSGGFDPTETKAGYSKHTQILDVWVPNDGTILAPFVGRKRPCGADVCLLKDGTELTITPEDRLSP